jgi:hypothetical protein
MPKAWRYSRPAIRASAKLIRAMSTRLEIQETSPANHVRWTYTGVLDDMVQSYPWPNIKITKKSLDVQLAYAVATGTPMLINDGYLILNPACFQSLSKADSPLRTLINKRYIRVLSRNPNKSLVQVVTNGADQGISTYQKLREKKQWDTVQRTLDNFQSDLENKDSFVGWPRIDLTASYLRLMHALADLPHADRGLDNVEDKLFREIVDCFDKELSKASGTPRSKFEKIIKEKASKSQRQSLMEMANEIYHHNFGIALTANPPEGFEGTEIAVQTRLSKAFLPLYKSHTPRIKQVSTLPLQICLPGNVDYSNGNLLVPLFDTEHPVGKSRSDYFRLRARYLAGEIDETDMIEMTNQYQRLLNEYWNSFSRHGVAATHFTNAAVTTGIVALSIAGIGTAAIPTVVIGTVAYFATEFGVPTLMEKWDLSNKLHLSILAGKFKSRPWQSALSKRAALISLTVNPSVAQALTNKLPLFTE